MSKNYSDYQEENKETSKYSVKNATGGKDKQKNTENRYGVENSEKSSYSNSCGKNKQ